MQLAIGVARHPFHSRRKFDRADVRVGAHIRVSGGVRTRVGLTDLSRTGFQMECLAYLPADRPVFLTLPGLAQLECSVAWQDDWHYGCAFVSPLYEAVFDHVVDAYSALR